MMWGFIIIDFFCVAFVLSLQGSLAVRLFVSLVFFGNMYVYYKGITGVKAALDEY